MDHLAPSNQASSPDIINPNAVRTILEVFLFSNVWTLKRKVCCSGTFLLFFLDHLTVGQVSVLKGSLTEKGGDDVPMRTYASSWVANRRQAQMWALPRLWQRTFVRFGPTPHQSPCAPWPASCLLLLMQWFYLLRWCPVPGNFTPKSEQLNNIGVLP